MLINNLCDQMWFYCSLVCSQRKLGVKSGCGPETALYDWNCMKSMMRGLSMLNWTDGTKVWLSREGCKWTKAIFYFFFAAFHVLYCAVCTGLMTVPDATWLIWTKKCVHLDSVCVKVSSGCWLCLCISTVLEWVCVCACVYLCVCLSLTVVVLFKVISVWKVFFHCSQCELKCQLSSHQEGEIKETEMSGLWRYAGTPWNHSVLLVLHKHIQTMKSSKYMTTVQ